LAEIACITNIFRKVQSKTIFIMLFMSHSPPHLVFFSKFEEMERLQLLHLKAKRFLGHNVP